MKTRNILKEWRNFLNESIKTKFKKSDIDKNVVIKDCCGSCHKNYKNVPKSGSLKGILKQNDLHNINDMNIVLVDIKGKGEKQFPQCCVELI